jgi:hypothetical protein
MLLLFESPIVNCCISTTLDGTVAVSTTVFTAFTAGVLDAGDDDTAAFVIPPLTTSKIDTTVLITFVFTLAALFVLADDDGTVPRAVFSLVTDDDDDTVVALTTAIDVLPICSVAIVLNLFVLSTASSELFVPNILCSK